MTRATCLTCGALLLLAAALVLAACSGGTSFPSGQMGLPTLAPVERAQTEAAVTLHDDLTISVSPARLPATVVKFTITNEGTATHGFGAEGHGLEQMLGPGTTTTNEMRLTAGTWTLYCPVADHRDRGMTTNMVVG